MPKIVIDKFLLNYEKVGQGQQPVIFLHGWGSSGQSFSGLAKLLAANNPKLSIYLLDLPGFGESNFPLLSMTVGDYAEVLKHYLAKLSISPTALVGHSFGGRVLIKYLSQNQSGAKLLLTGSAGVADRPNTKNYFYLLLAKLGGAFFSLPGLRQWRAKAQMALYQKVGSVDYLEADRLRETLKLVVAENLSEAAARVMAPTLLIWGSNDAETPLSEGKRLNELIPKSKLEIIDDAGHYVFLDQPDKFFRLATEFLK